MGGQVVRAIQDYRNAITKEDQVRRRDHLAESLTEALTAGTIEDTRAAVKGFLTLILDLEREVRGLRNQVGTIVRQPDSRAPSQIRTDPYNR
jgi:hypothetical protein